MAFLAADLGVLEGLNICGGGGKAIMQGILMEQSVGQLPHPPSPLLRQSCIICMYYNRSLMHYKSKTQAPRLYCVYSGLLSVHKLHFLADAYLSSLQFALCARSKWARLLHIGAICQCLFRWIYYCHSYKSTRKENGKMHLCVLLDAHFELGLFRTLKPQGFQKIFPNFPTCR